jgi:Lipopolysaccharide-assembly
MNKIIFICIAALMTACASSDVLYKPRTQQIPQHIKKLSIRTFLNKTHQFGLEEKITLKVTDEFLKNGEHAVVTENDAQGIIVGEITHYILTPIQYDVNMVPTVYKLNVLVSVKFLDKPHNTYLWEEPALQATKIYSDPFLPGGMTEEAAREFLWEMIAKDIVKRTTEGFGSATSASQKKIPLKINPTTPSAK